MTMALTGSKGSYLTSDKATMNGKRPRICMLTARGFALNAFRCGGYESEDVLLNIDDVDLIHLRPKNYYNIRESLQKYLIWHDTTRRMVSINMVFEPITFTRDYDLFIVHIPLMRDLIHLSAIRGWKNHCKRSICWIDEIYASNVAAYEVWMPALKYFDHIAVGMIGSVKTLESASQRPCHFVAGAVDTIRFSPYPHMPERVIDLYSIGRIGKELHDTVLDVAAKNNMFYIHDTFLASDSNVFDHNIHRGMYANMAKRSRYMFVAPAKMNMPEENKGQFEIGYRYYEASAAGAIMIGQAPNCESYHAMFNWPDAVIEIEPDGSNVANILADLAEQPERLLKISRRNVVESLLRHDWVYRWKKIYDIVGLNETEGMTCRENQLKAMAEQIGNE